MSRQIPSDDVRTGINASLTALDDRRYVRCKHCGFICHLDRDARAPRGSRAGDGITHSSIDYSEADDVTVAMGCPFCGCLLYNE